MQSEILNYEANGRQMESHLYADPANTGKRPGILVFPEVFGISDHTKEKAQKLAALGYVTLASDLLGDGKTAGSLDEAMGLVGPMMENPALTRAYAQAGLQALQARPEVDGSKIAAIGFCFGGSVSLELARGGNAVSGVAGFHSGLATAQPEDAKDIKGKVLVCIGADDPMIGPEIRQKFADEMTAGKVDWQMHLYGGVVHSFTNKTADSLNMPHAIRYSAEADKRSWNSLLAFLEEIFA